MKYPRGPAAVMEEPLTKPLEKSGKELDAMIPKPEDLPIIVPIYSTSDREEQLQ